MLYCKIAINVELPFNIHCFAK